MSGNFTVSVFTMYCLRDFQAVVNVYLYADYAAENTVSFLKLFIVAGDECFTTDSFFTMAFDF